MNYTYRIEVDDTVNNPRDDRDNLSRFLCPSNSRYSTGGKTDLEFHPREDGGENLRQLRREKCLIVEFQNPNVGTCYAFVTREQLKREYLDYGQTIRQAFYHARRVIKGEICEYLAWASGEVYGYIVEDEDGKHIDSCWGFFGDEGRKEAVKEAESIIKYHEDKDREIEAEITARFSMIANLV